MSDNYILSGLWLAATLGGIGYLGVTRTQETRVEAHAQEQVAVASEMRAAIDAANAGRYADAARMLEALQERHPRSNSIRLNLGIAYSALEMFDDADAQFAKVLADNPKDWDAVAERAVLKSLQGDEAGGISLLETIPEGEGQLDKRLQADPVWLKAKAQDRLQVLRSKHGIESTGDTSARRLREMERRRKEFEAANSAKTAATEDGKGATDKEPSP